MLARAHGGADGRADVRADLLEAKLRHRRLTGFLEWHPPSCRQRRVVPPSLPRLLGLCGCSGGGGYGGGWGARQKNHANLGKFISEVTRSTLKRYFNNSTFNIARCTRVNDPGACGSGVLSTCKKNQHARRVIMEVCAKIVSRESALSAFRARTAHAPRTHRARTAHAPRGTRVCVCVCVCGTLADFSDFANPWIFEEITALISVLQSRTCSTHTTSGR